MRDRKRKNPRMEQLLREIQQHHIMTTAWKYITRRYAPDVTQNNIGRIVYRHPKRESRSEGTLDINFCQSTTTTFDCCTRDRRHHCTRDRRHHCMKHIITNRTHSLILIKLRCGCMKKIGLNFYDALRNMESNAIRIARHINVIHALFYS